MIKKLLLFILLFFFGLPVFGANAYNRVSFYVVAHPDDWQLFMGLDAYNDMSDSTVKVVIIHTTAGDASCKGKKLDTAYYKAREYGAINSIEFCMDTKSAHSQDNFQNVQMNGHWIYDYSYKRIDDYFLRLPDGCHSCGLNGQSLEYFKNQQVNHITAVDSSTTYTDWADLVKTIQAIILNESGSIPSITLNVADVDTTLNPGDHPDHLHSAMAALDAVKGMNNVTKRLYVDYHISDLPINIAPENVAIKAAIFGVADFGLSQHRASSTWTKWHTDFLTRSYSRVIPADIDFNPNVAPVNEASTLTVYPNPAFKILDISYRINADENISMDIFDMDGKLVLPIFNGKRLVGDYINKVNIESLSPGNYVVKIASTSLAKSVVFVKN